MNASGKYSVILVLHAGNAAVGIALFPTRGREDKGSMRMTSMLLFAFLVVMALFVLAAWYALAVPGRSHIGPLPLPTAEEHDLVLRLKAHVMAIASVPHNVKHYPALEKAAQHIERTLQELGYAIDRQIFPAGGRAVRNIEAKTRCSRWPSNHTCDRRTLRLIRECPGCERQR